MTWWLFLAWFLLALIAMEGVAYLTHRFLMHGPLWFLHASHHVPHDGGWEWNDLFGALFAVPSILLIKAGVDAGGSWLLPVGLGMTAYGAIYVVFHDIVVHRRLRSRNVPQWTYLRRIIMAHLVHHKTHGKDGAVVRLPVGAQRPGPGAWGSGLGLGSGAASRVSAADRAS